MVEMLLLVVLPVQVVHMYNNHKNKTDFSGILLSQDSLPLKKGNLVKSQTLSSVATLESNRYHSSSEKITIALHELHHLQIVTCKVQVL
jgi:hypothetical protein